MWDKIIGLFKQPSRKPYWAIVIGSGAGLIAAFIQTIERIEWAARPNEPLICDINNTLSCSNVFGAWQSSVFGFSNALMCLAFFAIMLGFGLAVLYSSNTKKLQRLIAQFFAVFFLGFGAWYITQLIFVIGSTCIYCAFCYTGVIAINWGWLRVNIRELPLPKKVVGFLKTAIDKDFDTAAWIVYGLVFVAMFIIRFYT